MRVVNRGGDGGPRDADPGDEAASVNDSFWSGVRVESLRNSPFCVFFFFLECYASLGFPALCDSVLVAIWVPATPGEGRTRVHPSRLSRKETLLSHLTWVRVIT